MSRKVRALCFICGLAVCQALFWTALDRQAERWLNPGWKTGRTFSLPISLETEDKLSLSHNGKYLSYLREGELSIVHLMRQEMLGEPLPVEGILGSRWLPDRDTLLFVTAEEGLLGLGTLEIADYGAGDCRVIVKRHEEFAWPGLFVEDIELSTYTNDIFLLLRDKQMVQQLVRIDVGKTAAILQEGGAVSRMQILNRSGVLFLESSGDEGMSWVMMDGDASVPLDFPEGSALLGCSGDQVYMGLWQEDRLQRVDVWRYGDKGLRWEAEFWSGDAVTDGEVYAFAARVVFSGPKGLVVFENAQKTFHMAEAGNVLAVAPDGEYYLELTRQNGRTTGKWLLL